MPHLVNDSPSKSGKQPIVILSDCDLDQTVKGAHQNIRPDSTTTRILVHEDIHHIFVENLLDSIEAASHQQLSEPFAAPETSESNLELVQELTRSAQEDGAKIVTGGVLLDIKDVGGFFKLPTVIDNVLPSMRIFSEATIGPIATVSVFKENQDVMSWLNGVYEGSGAAIFAKDVEKAEQLASGVRSGVVSINRCNSTTQESEGL